MYAATGGQTWNGEAHILNEGAGTTALPAGDSPEWDCDKRCSLRWKRSVCCCQQPPAEIRKLQCSTSYNMHQIQHPVLCKMLHAVSFALTVLNRWIIVYILAWLPFFGAQEQLLLWLIDVLRLSTSLLCDWGVLNTLFGVCCTPH